MDAERDPFPIKQPDERRRGYSRSDHRARSHDSAHADEALTGAGPAPPEHPLIPRGPASLVTTAGQLDGLVARLRAGGSFAYDSEFIGELTYFPKLCLIQVASRDEVSLIDPLADFSLRPFWELLCDPAVEKIVHAGDQDIEPAIRHLGMAPANLFDTQVAAGFVGMPYPVSLSKLVFEFAGAKLGKGLTFSHWDQRPLSAVQLRYAADDVRFLPLVRAEIGRKLERTGHSQWAREECEALCDTSLYRFDPETQYTRVRGSSGLSPRNLAVLRELTSWRDATARAHDVPPRSLVRDEVLVDLARSPVKSVEKLARVRGLPRPVEQAHGARIVEATLRALALPADELPVQREAEQSPAEKFCADALWAAAQCLCSGRPVDPALVTNRQEVGEFCRLVKTNQDLTTNPLMTGWRKLALGEDLAALIRGQTQILLDWSDEGLRARVAQG